MDESEIEFETRLVAIEMLLCKMAATLMYRSLSSETLKALHEVERGSLSRETFPGLDAGMSDHVAAELEAAVAKLHLLTEEFHLRGRRAAHQE